MAHIARHFPACCAILLILVTPAWADFDTGMAAYQRGDYAAAFREWKPLVEHEVKPFPEKGNAKNWMNRIIAHFYLGLMYAGGEGVPQDSQEAVRLVRLAAEGGLSSAQAYLGTLYQSGEGVPQNYEEAMRWYRLAAEEGEAIAQFNLGAMYYKGEGVQQDYKEAVRWHRLAAEQGFAKAQAILGFMYGKGQGIPQDYVLSHMWFNLSAAQGDANSIKARDAISALMTPVQIAEAQKLAREWKSKKK